MQFKNSPAISSLASSSLASMAALVLLAISLGTGCESSASKTGLVTPQTRPKIEQIGQLDVEDESGVAKKIQDYADGKNLVVIVSRGYHGSVCPFCCAQTQSLASQYSKIEELGGKVLVIFPVEKSSDKSFSNELVEAAKIVMKNSAAELPFPIAYDVQLSAVDKLGIRGHLAKPATYILDQTGKLRFSYVGGDPADRPRVATIIDQLRAIK